MAVRSGRLEKRIQRKIAVEISALQHPPSTECVSTENVSPLGVRVVMQRPLEQHQRFMIRSLAGEQKTIARVVYCERLKDGRFAVGMQFLGSTEKWPIDLTGKPIW